MRRWISWPMMICGGGMALLGLGAVAIYVIEAVLKRMGEPDQSLVFWYLPILFAGLIGATLGVGLLVWGVRRRRPAKEEARG